MISRRPAGWMYVIAASYLSIHLIQTYLIVWGPDFPPDLNAVFESGAMHVRYVPPETPFSRAGLQAGDTVVTIGGLPIQSPREWSAALANVHVGQPATWEVLRGGKRLQLAVTFERAAWKSRLAVGAVDYYFTFSLVFLPLALLIGFRRPYDPVARLGSWLFLTASIAFGMLNGWAVVWRQLPAIVQFTLWIPEISRFVIEGIVSRSFPFSRDGYSVRV